MAKTKNGAGNGEAGGAKATKPAGSAPIQARVLTQFVRDLSFEVPNVDRILSGPAENPNIQLEVNVNARQVDGAKFESQIEFNAKATDSAGVIYDMEVVYGGIFEIGQMPKQALEPFLLVNCPAIIFPFLRRLVADLTGESGFPPLLLDPIDFAQLYAKRHQQPPAESA